MEHEHDWSSPLLKEESWRDTDVYVSRDGTVVIAQKPAYGEPSSEEIFVYIKPSDVQRLINALRECAKEARACRRG